MTTLRFRDLKEAFSWRAFLPRWPRWPGPPGDPAAGRRLPQVAGVASGWTASVALLGPLFPLSTDPSLGPAPSASCPCLLVSFPGLFSAAPADSAWP